MNPSDHAEIAKATENLVHELFVEDFMTMIETMPKGATATGAKGFAHLNNFKHTMKHKLIQHEKTTSQAMITLQNAAANIYASQEREIKELKNKNQCLCESHKVDFENRDTWYKEYYMDKKRLESKVEFQSKLLDHSKAKILKLKKRIDDLENVVDQVETQHERTIKLHEEQYDEDVKEARALYAENEKLKKKLFHLQRTKPIRSEKKSDELKRIEELEYQNMKLESENIHLQCQLYEKK